ncbi:hypothetical protein GTO91_15970 [Heliobacterium undosum]|uniref:Copper amine oxidase-like N-terminal domain-containing protein n=1 Tax=Heliomicrobium undosum TaxID=121734 RepID=A0A845L846_9FIRM|nr:stalk domain-containing protein [Heliomicrobium undosum]MZP31205.1 hypothetical protein [Heliomicrobium undosum]
MKKVLSPTLLLLSLFLGMGMPISANVSIPSAEAAAAISVVSAAPENANSPFNRRVIIEVPSGSLNADAQESAYLRFDSGVTVQRVVYSIPASVGSSPNLFVSGAGLLPQSENGFTLTVTGSGSYGGGMIVLDLEGISANSSVHDVRLRVEAPPGSIFYAGPATLTSPRLVDYAVSTRTAIVNQDRSDTIAFSFAEMEKGAIKTGIGSINLHLPEPLIWDASSLKVTTGKDEIRVADPVLTDGNRTLRIDVQKASTTPSTFELSGLAIRDGSNKLTDPFAFAVTLDGASRPGVERIPMRFAPKKHPPQPPTTSTSERATPKTVFTIGKTEYTAGDKRNPLDYAPFLHNGRAYLPVRAVAEAMGIAPENIHWQSGPDGFRVTLSKGGRQLTLQENSDQLIDSERGPVTMDAQMILTPANRVFLPLRWIAEPFGFDASYDEARRQVILKPAGGQ